MSVSQLLRRVARSIQAEVDQLPAGEPVIDLAREKFTDGIAQLKQAASDFHREARSPAPW
jgi:hypothetical protein